MKIFRSRRARRSAQWILFTLLAASAAFVLPRPNLQTRLAAQASSAKRPRVDDATRQRIFEAYGRLPLSFEPNRGQAPAEYQYLVHGSNYELRLAPREAVVSLQLENAAGRAEALGAPASKAELLPWRATGAAA